MDEATHKFNTNVKRGILISYFRNEQNRLSKEQNSTLKLRQVKNP